MLIDISQLPATIGTVLGLFLLFSLVAILSAFAAMMFQWFQQPNMIFWPWAILLSKISSKGEMWRHLMRPLGRCRYCNGIWITMYAFIYIFGFNLLILLAMAMNYMSIYLLSTYVITNLDPAAQADKHLKIQFEHANTPWQDMLKTYAIMGAGYSIIYGIIPLIV